MGPSWERRKQNRWNRKKKKMRKEEKNTNGHGKMGTFGNSANTRVQKMALRVPKWKFFYHFYKSNISQKWWNYLWFQAFTTFGLVLNQFSNFIFSPCILHYELKKIRDAFSRHFSDLTKKEKWSKIVSKTWIQGAPPLGSNFNQNDSRYSTLNLHSFYLLGLKSKR